MPPELITFRFFAKAYSWTPDQVRSLSVEELEWLPLIEVAVSEADRQEQAAQERVRKRAG